jgi:hypothetical protein
VASITDCRTRRQRDAPNAIRIAICFLREADRATNKFATLSVEIISKQVVAAINK